MKFVDGVESAAHLERMVIQELKNLGIKVPKPSKKPTAESTSLQAGSRSVVFGNNLANLPCVDIDVCGPVPRFLVDVCQLIEKDIDTEGIFRKSGSVMRQKELRAKIELSHDMGEASAIDVASLLKQFIRDLPEPLLTFRLQDAFMKCQTLVEPDFESALFLLCSVLPTHHLATLRFLMAFLSRVAERAVYNKMDSSNLALCLTPNVFRSDGSSVCRPAVLIENKTLQSQTAVVQILIERSDMIGMIADEMVETVFLRTSYLSDSEAENDGETDKGKKRNGIMTNLSNSFSKWRNRDRQNSSAICSTSNSFSVNADGMEDLCQDCLQYVPPVCSMAVEGTPIMRKRKANTELTPFSAGKKKAILRNMPQMSAIGVASFTPGNRRDEISEPCELLSSQPTKETATKVGSKIGGIRRAGSLGHSPNVSSQTPSKNRLRKSLEGFMRRLSGGRESQETQKDIDFAEATADGVRTLVYHKSPSSPAFSSIRNSDITCDHNNSFQLLCDPASAQGETVLGHSDLGTLPGCPTTLLAKSISQDSSFSRSCGLKRGKPNTVKTGLPSPLNRRSLDITNNTRLTLNNEVRRNNLAVIDTSPINGDQVSISPLQQSFPNILKEVKRQLNFQASPGSLMSTETYGVSPENSHDCAFIDFSHESGYSPTTACTFNVTVTSDNALDVVDSQTNAIVVSPVSISGNVSSSETMILLNDPQTGSTFSNSVVLLSVGSGTLGTVGFSEVVGQPCTPLKSNTVPDEMVHQPHDSHILDTVLNETVLRPSDQLISNTVSNAVVVLQSDCPGSSTNALDESVVQPNGGTLSHAGTGLDRLGYASPSPCHPSFSHLVSGLSSDTVTPKRLPRLLDPVERFVCLPSTGNQDGNTSPKSTSRHDLMPEGVTLSLNTMMTPVPKIKQPLISDSLTKKMTAKKTGSSTPGFTVRKKGQLLSTGTARCEFPLKTIPRNNV